MPDDKNAQADSGEKHPPEEKGAAEQGEAEELPGNSEDIAREKEKAANEFNASGNAARNQFFINSLTVGGGGKADYEALLGLLNGIEPAQKTYDLTDPAQCASFVETYMDGEYLALAIVLATFGAVSVGDLPGLMTKLLDRLPVAPRIDGQGAQTGRPPQSPYLSLHSMLAMIGGIPPVEKEGQRYTGFGAAAPVIFTNIWEQFPRLWDGVVSWLVDVAATYEYRTTFAMRQITAALARVVSMDFAGAQKRVFERLYSNPSFFMVLGALAYTLLDDPSLRDNTLGLLRQWARSDSSWKWKACSLAFVYADGTAEMNGIEKPLMETVEERLAGFEYGDRLFIAILSCHSERIRAMVAKAVHRGFDKLRRRDERTVFARGYLLFLRQCYYFVSGSLTELPFVACDTKEQQALLAPVISHVMSQYGLRRFLYGILRAYVTEISGYRVAAPAFAHISAFFYNMGLSDAGYRRDVSALLTACDCSRCYINQWGQASIRWITGCRGWGTGRSPPLCAGTTHGAVRGRQERAPCFLYVSCFLG